MTCRSGQKRSWNQTRLYSFVFLYACSILWQGQKAVLTIVEFEFFDIFYSEFQLVSTFSICSKFCVENWLLCCDLICKWVTCRSGCKRFWKSALHIIQDTDVFWFKCIWEMKQRKYLQKVIFFFLNSCIPSKKVSEEPKISVWLCPDGNASWADTGLIGYSIYTPIAFDQRVTFWLQNARSLPCACVFAALYVCAIL